MIKRLLLGVILILLIGGSLLGYGFFRYGENDKKERQNAKAPQQTVVIAEGLTVKDIADALEKKGVVKAQDFLAAEKNFSLNDYPIVKTSKPKTADLEGYIFPDTYFIPQNPLPGQDLSQVIIQKALDNFSRKITGQMQKDAEKNGLTLYQTLILASIIEKESAAEQDRPAIAGVFLNRLKTVMPLQSDATVNYFTGKNDPGVSREDTEMDNPYNTYKNKGLPPGPICSPSLSSILATINPAKNDYFYFLTDPKTGSAVFAKTYDEHLMNKQKYLK
jgi:UPF0755 protein